MRRLTRAGSSGPRLSWGRAGRWLVAITLFTCGLPARIEAQDSEPDTSRSAAAAYAAADSTRRSYDRPPREPPTDWVDVAEFPLKVVAFPFRLILVDLPAWIAGQVLVPRAPSGIVRAYRAVENWGLRPVIRSSIGSRSSAAIEAQLFRYEPLYLHSAISVRGSQRHRAGLLVAEPGYSLATEAKWQRDAQLAFYGIGPGSSPDRGLYRRDYWDLRARGTARLTGELGLDLGVGYEDNRIGDPVGTDDETIWDEFDADSLYGASVSTSYVRLEGGLTLDLTDRREFQVTGAWLRVEGVAWRGTSTTDSDFHALSAIAQGYLPLNTRQQLALRVATRVTRSDGGDGIPFFHLSRLGGTRTAIGYSSGRFTDNDMLSLVAEWRYEVWRDIHDIARSEFFLYVGEGRSSDVWATSPGTTGMPRTASARGW